MEKVQQQKPQQSNDEILNEIKAHSFNDRAFGCVIGAFIADACGSYNEFNPAI